MKRFQTIGLVAVLVVAAVAFSCSLPTGRTAVMPVSIDLKPMVSAMVSRTADLGSAIIESIRIRIVDTSAQVVLDQSLPWQAGLATSQQPGVSCTVNLYQNYSYRLNVTIKLRNGSLLTAAQDFTVPAADEHVINVVITLPNLLVAMVSFDNPTQPSVTFTGVAVINNNDPEPLNIVAPSGFASYSWEINGYAQTSATSNVLQIYGYDSSLQVGQNRVVLIVGDGVDYYSAEVVFTLKSVMILN